MGTQLIFAVEANAKSKSDWIYIKEAIYHFYEFDKTSVKFSTVYMDGKGNYLNKKKSIEKLIKEYKSVNKHNISIVIYCVDTDSFTNNKNDINLFEKIREFCSKESYKLIWFNKDIEDVFLNSRIENSYKKKAASKFCTSEAIKSVKKDILECKDINFKRGSNILIVLDEIEVLKRK